MALLIGLIAQPTYAAADVAAPSPQCSHVGYPNMKAFSAKVWAPSNWRRGQPSNRIIEAWHHKLKCASGPGHRKAGKHRWRADRRAFLHERRRCQGGEVFEGRVSYFNGPASTTASGLPVTTPGLAINIAPGTESGWNNSITRGWMAAAARGEPQMALASLDGHHGYLPIIDLGPHQSTFRAIDYTEAAVFKVGFTLSTFVTDHIGRVRLIPPGCL